MHPFDSLPNNKILNWFKLKTFADDKINETQILKFVLKMVENIGRKHLYFVIKNMFLNYNSTNRQVANVFTKKKFLISSDFTVSPQKGDSNFNRLFLLLEAFFKVPTAAN